MKKSGQEANMFGIPLPGADMLQPQAMMDCCQKMSAQMEDLGRTMISSAQRNVESTWEMTAQLARSSSPSDAMRLYRDWLDERRDAFFADGKQISQMMLKLYDMRPMTSAASTAPVSSMARSASAAE